jgi:hypothetical protein
METEFCNSIVEEECFLKNPKRFEVGASLNTPDESTFYGGDDSIISIIRFWRKARVKHCVFCLILIKRPLSSTGVPGSSETVCRNHGAVRLL